MAKPAKAKASQHEIDRSLNDAAWAELDKIEALAQKILQEKNPFSEPATPFSEQADDDEKQRWKKENQKWLKEEEEWIELARTARQLRPSLEALIKADEPNSEHAKYGPGFRLRLLEAQATIARLTEYERLYRLRQRRRGGKNRPNAISPFTQFIACHLKRNPEASAGEIKAAFVNEARAGDSGLFELSPDKLSILATGRKKGLKISGIPAEVAKARKKLPRK